MKLPAATYRGSPPLKFVHKPDNLKTRNRGMDYKDYYETMAVPRTASADDI